MAFELHPLTQADPRVTFCFKVIVEGIFTQGVISVDGLETETDQIDYRLGNENPFVRQVRGLTKAGALTIVVPKTQGKEWRRWREQVWSRSGQMSNNYKRKVIIEELDPIDRRTVLERHIYKDAWPSKITDSKLDSLTSEIATMTIELRHSGPKYETG